MTIIIIILNKSIHCLSFIHYTYYSISSPLIHSSFKFNNPYCDCISFIHYIYSSVSSPLIDSFIIINYKFYIRLAKQYHIISPHCWILSWVLQQVSIYIGQLLVPHPFDTAIAMATRNVPRKLVLTSRAGTRIGEFELGLNPIHRIVFFLKTV